jgi:hypothetical protein
VKLLALLMGILLSVQLTICPIADAAAAMSVTSNGGVQGQLPVNKIGALLLADGVAIMNGDNIQVQGKDHDGKSQTQLSGHVFKVSQAGSVISGFAYFEDGLGLASLATGCPEDVVLTDGSKVDGPISSITTDAVTASGRSIPMSQVLKIHSPRVFNFKINGESARRISFEPTCLHPGAAVKATKTTTKGDSRMHRTTAWCKRHPYYTTLIVAAVGCGIACAIALPIAIPLAQHHGGGGSSSGNSSSGNSGNGLIYVVNGQPFQNGHPIASGGP